MSHLATVSELESSTVIALNEINDSIKNISRYIATSRVVELRFYHARKDLIAKRAELETALAQIRTLP